VLDRLRWLGLEVTDRDAARAFYDPLLVDRVDEPDPAGDGDQTRTDPRPLVYRVGGGDPETRLVLRRPDSVPRGGVHTHYALAVPEDEYADWRAHLAADHPVAEHDFGVLRSLYVDDPDGHCVELAGVDVAGPGVDGVFEVVLEVRDLARARSFYETLGYRGTDESDDRLRLAGPGETPDVELWEPRRGIAGARGGLHVDLGVAAPDPAAVATAVADAARRVDRPDGRVRVVDPDGHHLTVLPSA
jgi:catechol 2,3-dioxygenase-like lactoylglutathione lyase family enzyme